METIKVTIWHVNCGPGLGAEAEAPALQNSRVGTKLHRTVSVCTFGSPLRRFCSLVIIALVVILALIITAAATHHIPAQMCEPGEVEGLFARHRAICPTHSTPLQVGARERLTGTTTTNYH